MPEAHRTLEYRLSQSQRSCAVRSPLGWSLVGPTGQVSNNEHVHFNVNFVQSYNALLHSQLQKMYDAVFVGRDRKSDVAVSVHDKKAVSIMEKSVVKVNNHYQIALPWKSRDSRLPSNKHIAEKRLSRLKEKLDRDPKLLKLYRDKINEYLTFGYARKIPDDELAHTPRTWYIPHHATGGKFRVVFDRAAKCKGTSLNDHLLQGLDQASTLLGVLLRFRRYPIVVIADVKGMFHQVRVETQDRDSQRFLWWPDGDLSCPPVEYQMLVHVFGATSSPSVCGFALRQAAADNEIDAPPEVVQTVENIFFADDLLKSFENEDDAIRVTHMLGKLLECCSFYLTKFLSNSKRVLSTIPEQDRKISDGAIELDSLNVERALGVICNLQTDSFRVRVDISAGPMIRRGLLSMLSQCYDPLGFIQPALLPPKKLIQELCSGGLGWDDPVPQEIKAQSERWLACVGALQRVKIKRCYRPQGFKSNSITLLLRC